MMAKRKNPAAVALGKRGAKARLKKLSPEKRTEVAKKAAAARWRKPAAKPKKARGQRRRGNECQSTSAATPGGIGSNGRAG